MILRAARILVTAVIMFSPLLAAARADGHQVHWQQAGASTFGGPCEPREWRGYMSDDLTKLWHSFAELERNTALGGLPYKTRIRVLNPHTHRRLNIYKRDWGTGGARVGGLVRSIDLYFPVVAYLQPGASCSSWSGVILWRRI